MTTRKVRPEPRYLDRQRDSQRHRATGGYVVAFVIALAAVALVLANISHDGQAPLQEPSLGPTVTPTEASMGFLDAFGSFDAERTQGYLAMDADVTELVRHVSSELEGTPTDLPTVLSMLRAQKYEASVDTCDQVDASSAATTVRCSVRWNLLRSGDLGLGPYPGVYTFTVRDGAVVRAASTYTLQRFTREMWDPFKLWVSAHHPAQARAMFDPSHTEGSVTPRSIALWDRNVDEYVRYVLRSSA